MKNNNKNRKLKYIRQKNSLHNGGMFRAMFKISNDIKEEEFIRKMLDMQAKSICKRLSKIYKMPICVANVKTGWDSDDFIRELISVVLTLKKAA